MKFVAPLCLAALLLFLNPPGLSAQTFTALDNGMEAFHGGNFEEAQRHFTDALRQHGPSAALYYNQGLALEKAGDTGGAVLAYLRALSLEPALAPARSALQGLAAEKNLPLPSEGVADALIRRAGTGTIWTLGAVAGWLGLIAAGAAFLRPKNRLVIVLAAVVFLGLGGALLGVVVTADPLLANQTLAVVQGKNALPLRPNPVEAAGPVGRLAPGTVVEVLSERSPWAYVEIPGGKKGWLPLESMAAVIPPSLSPQATALGP